MLSVSVTAEAPTGCGGGGTPAPATVRSRRERTESGYGSALTKSKKPVTVNKPAAREPAATSAVTIIVEPLKQYRLIQVQPHYLQ